MAAFRDAVRKLHEKGTFQADILATKEGKKLLSETANTYIDAIGSSITHETPGEIKYALEHNAFQFSGFKSYHSLREAGLYLTNEDGTIKPFEQFLNDVKKVNEQYNRNYLRAEYNHAVASAQMAYKWNDIKADGDDYNLQYRTAGDDRVRPEHAALHGITLPPSDPFWKEYYPPNSWNCRCQAVQVNKDKYPETDRREVERKSQGVFDNGKSDRIFRNNVGETLEIFPKKHPYYKTAPEDKEIVEKTAQRAETKHIKELARKTVQGTTLTHPKFKGDIKVSRNSIDEWTNQPHVHYAEKNRMILYIGEILKKSTYIGYKKDNSGKPGTKYVHIFETSILGDKTWIVVKEYQDGNIILYSISDSPNILKGIERK